MDIDLIGHTVRVERLRRGLTQATVASMAGVSKGRIEAIENGRVTDMGFKTVCQVLTGLGFRIQITRGDEQ